MEEPSIKVLETTFTTYILGIDVIRKTIYEEPASDQILRVIMKTIKELQKQQEKNGKAIQSSKES